MKRLLLLFLTIAALFNFEADAAISCRAHRIYCAIVKLQPDIDRTQAMKASNALYEASRHYNTDPMQSVAIIFQESRWDVDLSVVVHKNGAVDLGLAQINLHTARHMGYQVPKLIADPVYALWAHTRILKRKINICKNKGWALGAEYSCYHSFSKKHRTTYARKVQQWIKKIKETDTPYLALR